MERGGNLSDRGNENDKGAMEWNAEWKALSKEGTKREGTKKCSRGKQAHNTTQRRSGKEQN